MLLLLLLLIRPVKLEGLIRAASTDRVWSATTPSSNAARLSSDMTSALLQGCRQIYG